MTDLESLRQYAATGSQDAFAADVRQHVDMVYSAARRQTGGDDDLAEEITQRVFIALARKAGSLKDEVLLGGWLFNAVRLMACDAMRKKRRRILHEHKAAQMAKDLRNASAPSADDPWNHAEEFLNDAMGRLGAQSRGLIVLKFFQGLSAREVGDRLGISEEAARKRISRAVDELRDLFGRKGVAMSAAGLAEALATKAVLTAPKGLAASAASAATSLATTTAIGSGAALMATAAAKTKIAAAIIVGALALGGGTIATVQVLRYFTPPKPRTVTVVSNAPKVSGIVRGPDGKPVSGAEFYVGSTQKQAYAYGSNLPRGVNGPTTGADGKFIADKPDKPNTPYAVVVRAPQGYAEVSGKQLEAAGGEIKLQPWARIEGVVMKSDRPVPKATVHLWRVGENDELVHHESEVKADANGRFVFPKVAPGEMCLYLVLPSFRSAQWRYVIAEPGQTVQTRIGNNGRSVRGRIDVPPDMAKLIAWTDRGKYTYEARIRLDPEPSNPVQHARDESLEQYWAKELAFGRTPEGRIYKEWRFGSEFSIDKDGTFQIDDLPPGKFNATVRCFEENAEVSFLEDIASVELKFEVPPVTATQPATSVPIDIGTAVPKLLSRVRPGDRAPADFEVKTIDGQTWRYADHRGKPLVLVFWGTYSNTDQLKSFGDFARKWDKDPRLSILGCFAARDIAEAKQFIADNKLDFPQTADESLMGKFGSSWPEAVVVSTDGIILQKHLHDRVLEKYVNKSLGIATTKTTSAR
jgi:RNA polymerase sigma factor (sigma-70 family)